MYIYAHVPVAGPPGRGREVPGPRPPPGPGPFPHTRLTVKVYLSLSLACYSGTKSLYSGCRAFPIGVGALLRRASTQLNSTQYFWLLHA